MKKHLFGLVIISLLTGSVQGQILKGGVNFANISTTNDGDIDDANMLTSFHVGLSGDWKLLPMLHLQPAILFTG